MLGCVQLTTVAHEPVKAALVDAAKGVRLASPFLGPGPMADLVTAAATNSTVSWKLPTRLEVNAVASGHLDLVGIRNTLAAGVLVRTLPNLHAKVYLTPHRLSGSSSLAALNLAEYALSSPGPTRMRVRVQIARADTTTGHARTDSARP